MFTAKIPPVPDATSVAKHAKIRFLPKESAIITVKTSKVMHIKEAENRP